VLWCDGTCKCAPGTVTTYMNKHSGKMVCHEKPMGYNAQVHHEAEEGDLEDLSQGLDTVKHGPMKLPDDYLRCGGIRWKLGPGAIVGYQEELKAEAGGGCGPKYGPRFPAR
jgi:hypothetical protein